MSGVITIVEMAAAVALPPTTAPEPVIASRFSDTSGMRRPKPAPASAAHRIAAVSERARAWAGWIRARAIMARRAIAAIAGAVPSGS